MAWRFLAAEACDRQLSCASTSTSPYGAEKQTANKHKQGVTSLHFSSVTANSLMHLPPHKQYDCLRFFLFFCFSWDHVCWPPVRLINTIWLMMDDLNFSYLEPIYHSRRMGFFHYFFSLFRLHFTQKFKLCFHFPWTT